MFERKPQVKEKIVSLEGKPRERESEGEGEGESDARDAGM